MKRLVALCALVALGMPWVSHAQNPDLSISPSGISFSTSTLYAGDTVRIYASVRNVGDVDVTGYVYFYQGSLPIDRSQSISLRADGPADEVFVDFTVPTGSFNIRAVIQGSSPQDVNPGNDVAVTQLFYPLVDEDRDGVLDDDDNCVNEANADQLDTDGDGTGDACDDDKDNDGVANATDPEPTNPNVSRVEVVPKPVTQSEAKVTSTPTGTSTDTSASTASPSSQDADEGEEDDDAAADASAVSWPSSAISTLNVSPNARFTYRQIDWRTYEFILADQPEEGIEFSWDFGDGASSVQPQITHSFSGSGSYVVTLNTLDTNGNRASDAQTFAISFFHLSNPLVQAVLGLLIGVLIVLGITMYKVQRRIHSLSTKQSKEDSTV